MGTKTSEWRPGPTVCRCCLAEGCYKDISTEYFWMGKKEVYAEMLAETFDISIAYATSGPNSNSRLICEPCISRLRDASEFKKQVFECEKTFMQHLDPGASTHNIEVSIEPMDKEVKLERVKQEKQLSDDDDDFEAPDFHDDDDDDDLDDQPLTKFATKVPKKEPIRKKVDILDLLDNAKATEKRKSTTKLKVPPTKKAKAKVKESPKPTASKVQVQRVKKKKDHQLAIARQNAKTILRYSTAYPFRLPVDKMVCVYCCDSYDDPVTYREHMKTEHATFKVENAFVHLATDYQEFLKIDCTELTCRICCKSLDDIQSAAKHLVEKHGRNIDVEAGFGMQVFKLGEERWVCFTCGLKFPALRSLSRHMSSHYYSYTCETCGKMFRKEVTLKRHRTHVHSNAKICLRCKKSFPDTKARRLHLIESRRCWQLSCTHCGERFLNKKTKLEHMLVVHNEDRKLHVCPECAEVFETYMAYRTHFITKHTKNNFECSYCNQKFDRKRSLEEHVVMHTKNKLFPCTVCNKSFPRKKNLDQHMWLHREVKRFKCAPCNKQFNQRVSWRMHMKNHHPDS